MALKISLFTTCLMSYWYTQFIDEVQQTKCGVVGGGGGGGRGVRTILLIIPRRKYNSTASMILYTALYHPNKSISFVA